MIRPLLIIVFILEGYLWKKLNITMSLGIYEIKEEDNEEDLLRKADKALYEAKNTGRNKVVVYYD